MMSGIETALGGAFTLGLFHLTQKARPRQEDKSLLRSATIYSGGIALAVVPPVRFSSRRRRHDMLLDLVLMPAKHYVGLLIGPFPFGNSRSCATQRHRKLGSLDQLAILPAIVVSCWE